MLGPFQMLRMARWAKNPPSWRMVVFVGCVIVFMIGLFIVERYIGWPEWATVNGTGRGRMPRF